MNLKEENIYVSLKFQELRPVEEKKKISIQEFK